MLPITGTVELLFQATHVTSEKPDQAADDTQQRDDRSVKTFDHNPSQTFCYG